MPTNCFSARNSSTSDSNTPRPPGTWLISPAVWATRNTPRTWPNPTVPNGGSNTYSTTLAITQSNAPTAICDKASRGRTIGSIHGPNWSGWRRNHPSSR